jgi:hypothetical protein
MCDKIIISCIILMIVLGLIRAINIQKKINIDKRKYKTGGQ